MPKGTRRGRSINGVVFGLSTPRRHGNSKSSDFLNESGLDLKEPKTSPLKGTRPSKVIIDDLHLEDFKKEKD
jgi:hypothetical protein